jgi:hypothetical protein
VPATVLAPIRPVSPLEGDDRKTIRLDSAAVGVLEEAPPPQLLSRPTSMERIALDRPLRLDPTDPSKDEPETLGRLEVARNIARALEAVDPPSCIALYGPWGAGKTSLLRLIERQFTSDLVSVVHFEPWLYEKRGDVGVGLINTLTRTARRLHGGALPSDLVALAVGLLKPVIKGGLSLTTFGLAEGMVDGAVEAGADWLERFEDATDPATQRASLQRLVRGLLAGHVARVNERRAATRVPQLSSLEAPRLIVLVDDLDRCLPETTIELIELSKLFLCASPGTPIVFLFAVDRDVVGEAIRHRYGGSKYSGENYLEKIFDFAFEVPSVPGGKVSDYLTAKMPWWTAADPLKGELDRVLGDPALANPRVWLRAGSRLSRLQQQMTHTDGDWTVQDVGRMIAWMGGGERFREFRRYFFKASSLHRFALHRAVIDGASLGDFATELPVLHSTGFRRYYSDLLMLARRTTAESLELETDPNHLFTSAPRRSLAFYDTLLHAHGL